jgi:hypothetical protein
MRLPSLLGLVVLAACAKNESTSPAAQPVEASPFVVPARPAPPAPALVEADASSEDAGAMAVAAVDAAPPPLAAQCIGGMLDLTFLVQAGLCRDGTRGKPVKAGALRMMAVPPKPLARGASGSSLVTLMNTSGAELDLYVDLPSFETVARISSGGAPAAPPRDGPTLKIRQSTTSADGKRSFDATWNVLGLLAPVAHFRLASGGTALLRVSVHARGFLPGKDYEPGSHAIDDPPDPLPPGRYKVTLHVPVWTEGTPSPVVDLEVR